MKKTLLFVSALTFGASLAQAQNCSEIFISEYVEGSGNDKAIELYNPTATAINLSGYRVERFSNGQATSATGGVLNLSGTIAPYSAFVIANGQTTSTPSSPACSLVLQGMADLLDGVYPAPTYMNGNDAIALFNGANMIDLMGKTGDASMTSAQSWSDQFPYDGSAGAWWTKDHTLTRKASVKTGVTTNPATFIVTTEWDSLPQDTWTGLGAHTCDCLLGLTEVTNSVSFTVYPNPVVDGQFAINASEAIESVQIINLLGQVVITENFNDFTKSKMINAAILNKGMYTVKLKFSNNSVSQTNLVVQ
jgi:predicted extracellular nuclease